MIGLGIGGRGIGLGLGRSVGAAAFVGAYDAIPNIVAAYGMRRLRTAYTGSLLRLRRSSDNAEQDIGYDGSGHLDTAAVATFVGAGSGYIVNWYDQSGNAYTATQATAGSQPLYVASGQNGRPVVRFDGVNDYLTKSSSGLPSGNSDTTITAVIKSRSRLLYNCFLSWGSLSVKNGIEIYAPVFAGGLPGTPGTGSIYGVAYAAGGDGGFSNVDDGNAKLIGAIYNNLAGRVLYLNGAASSLLAITGHNIPATPTLWIGANFGSVTTFGTDDDIAELIICNIDAAVGA